MVGFDQIIENVLRHLGSVKKAYITGDLARGKDTNQINLFLIGSEIDNNYLEYLINKTKTLIHRDIVYKLLKECEEAGFREKNPEAFIILKGSSEK
jgi:hypothetical protein